MKRLLHGPIRSQTLPGEERGTAPTAPRSIPAPEVVVDEHLYSEGRPIKPLSDLGSVSNQPIPGLAPTCLPALDVPVPQKALELGGIPSDLADALIRFEEKELEGGLGPVGRIEREVAPGTRLDGQLATPHLRLGIQISLQSRRSGEIPGLTLE